MEGSASALVDSRLEPRVKVDGGIPRGSEPSRGLHVLDSALDAAAHRPEHDDQRSPVPQLRYMVHLKVDPTSDTLASRFPAFPA